MLISPLKGQKPYHYSRIRLPKEVVVFIHKYTKTGNFSCATFYPADKEKEINTHRKKYATHIGYTTEEYTINNTDFILKLHDEYKMSAFTTIESISVILPLMGHNIPLSISLANLIEMRQCHCIDGLEIKNVSLAFIDGKIYPVCSYQTSYEEALWNESRRILPQCDNYPVGAIVETTNSTSLYLGEIYRRYEVDFVRAGKYTPSSTTITIFKEPQKYHVFESIWEDGTILPYNKQEGENALRQNQLRITGRMHADFTLSTRKPKRFCAYLTRPTAYQDRIDMFEAIYDMEKAANMSQNSVTYQEVAFYMSPEQFIGHIVLERNGENFRTVRPYCYCRKEHLNEPLPINKILDNLWKDPCHDHVITVINEQDPSQSKVYTFTNNQEDNYGN